VYAGPCRNPSLEPIPPREVSRRLIRTDVFTRAAVGPMLTAACVFHDTAVEDGREHVFGDGDPHRWAAGHGAG